MNLLYTSLFFQESYIQLLALLLKSIGERGNIDNTNTHILIMTSPEFKPKIEEIVKAYNFTVKYFLHNLNSVMEASSCRLNIFDYENINDYTNLLYIDADVLINNDVNVLFNHPIENKIYALEEGTIGGPWWGREFFDFSVVDGNKSAFCAGVLYFKNTPEIKNLFNDVKVHIADWYSKGNQTLTCLEQPFLVYHSVTKGIIDNQLLHPFLINNPVNVDDRIIYHFAGGPGNFGSKCDKMSGFLPKMRDYWAAKIPKPVEKVDTVEAVEIVESNKIFDNRNDMIVYYSKRIEHPSILEIGIFRGEFFNFILNNCNPKMLVGVDIFDGMSCSGDANGNNVVYYDIGQAYNELCDKYKNHSNVTLIKNNSVAYLSKCNDNVFDIIYIDGDHSYNGVKNDLENAYHKIKKGGFIMGHDYEMNFAKTSNNYDFGVKQAVNEFCQKYNQTILSKAMDGCVSFCIKINK